MNKALDWIKKNKFLSVLLLVIALLLCKFPHISFVGSRTNTRGKTSLDSVSNLPSLNVGRGGAQNYESAQSQNRMVVKTSNLSLVVKNVSVAISNVGQKVQSLGGFVVNSSVVSPEGLSKGSITVRVPTQKLTETINYLENEVSLKIISKEIRGRDITDDYVDTNQRIKTLQTSKTKYESMLDLTNDVDQILKITDNIINLEQRIDNMIGRKEYLEQTSQTALIRVNLATTELELPYSPETTWQPKVIFKYAVRSLFDTGRKLGSAIIWLGVYSIIWVPALVIFLVIKKKIGKNKTGKQS